MFLRKGCSHHALLYLVFNLCTFFLSVWYKLKKVKATLNQISVPSYQLLITDQASAGWPAQAGFSHTFHQVRHVTLVLSKGSALPDVLGRTQCTTGTHTFVISLKSSINSSDCKNSVLCRNLKNTETQKELKKIKLYSFETNNYCILMHFFPVILFLCR